MDQKIGIDAVSISRIKSLVEKFEKQRLLHIWTDREIEYCFKKNVVSFESLAGRYAAKEALLKAAGIGIAEGVSLNEIEVYSAGKQPRFELYGKTAKILKNIGLHDISLSITHDGGLAIAVCSILINKQNKEYRTMSTYPIIDGNFGAFISRIDEKEAQAILCPTGVRLMAARSDLIVYEVIRISGGKLLFWEDHMHRMETSAKAKNLSMPGKEEIMDMCRRLYSAQKRNNANLRIVLTKDCCLAHYSRVYYPDEKMIKEGVPVGTLNWERQNPGIKTVIPEYKIALNSMKDKDFGHGKIFEVILKDKNGKAIEGGRSNLFYMKGNEIFTASSDKVLEGISRKYVIQAAKKSNLAIHYEVPLLEDVKQGGWSVFITGSPIDILPVSYIDDCKITTADTNPNFDLLQKEYFNIVNNSNSPILEV